MYSEVKTLSQEPRSIMFVESLDLTQQNVDDFKYVLALYRRHQLTGNKYMRNEARAMAGKLIFDILEHRRW